MKVAIYSGKIPSTIFIENLIDATASKGIDVLLFGVKSKSVSYQNNNIKIKPLPNSIIHSILLLLHGGIKLWFIDRSSFIKLYTHINSISTNRRHVFKLWVKYLPIVLSKPEIFHLQWAKGIAEWLFLKEHFNIKIVLSLRGSHINNTPIIYPEIKKTYKSCFPVLDGFQAVCHDVSKSAMSYGAKSNRIQVIHSGVDLLKLKFTPFVKRGNKDLQINMISVGRLHWIKGYNYALDAIAGLRKCNININYTIIGSGFPEELMFQVEDLGLSDVVTFKESLPHEQVIQQMTESDILLLPSVSEGIANVVLEAMAIGLPVVSSDCGGMTEVVSHGENGLLFMNRNPEDLINKIVEFNNLTQTQLSVLVKNARTTIEERFSTELLGNTMKQFYDKVLIAEFPE